MTVAVGAVLLLVAAGLLVGGAELFAEHVRPAAARVGLPVFAVGLLLAGAEPEELVTTVVASARHHPGLAVGDLVGANLLIGTLASGLCAVVRPCPSVRPPAGTPLSPRRPVHWRWRRWPAAP